MVKTTVLGEKYSSIVGDVAQDFRIALEDAAQFIDEKGGSVAAALNAICYLADQFEAYAEQVRQIVEKLENME